MVAMGAAPSVAADAIGAPPPVPAYSQSQDYTVHTLDDVWTGFYLGAHLGGYFPDDDDDDDGEWLAGLQAGYNHQFGVLVVGGEVSASFTDELTYSLTPDAALTQDWMLGVSARAGFALDRTLIYGTLGYNWAELSPSGTVTSEAETVGGVSFGAGVEHQFGNGLGARLEYTQTRFDDVETTLVGGASRSDDLVNHAVKAGLNFHF